MLFQNKFEYVKFSIGFFFGEMLSDSIFQCENTIYCINSKCQSLTKTSVRNMENFDTAKYTKRSQETVRPDLFFSKTKRK